MKNEMVFENYAVDEISTTDEIETNGGFLEPLWCFLHGLSDALRGK